MNQQRYPPLLALPDELEDAAVVALLKFFYEAARIIENHYTGQLLRYYHRPDPPQQPLWHDHLPF